MNIIITMAGLGSRFKRVGYTIPKYRIEVNGKNLFQWSMLSLTDFNKQRNVKYIFIVRKEDNAKEFIINEMNKLGINDVNIIELKELTDGQATSALFAKKYWDEEQEMIVYNIDTYVESGEIKYSDISGDGFIPCFNAKGKHWSFVKLDKHGTVIEVREKQRISNNCTIGLYYFKSSKLYEQIYNEYYIENRNLEKNEKYIAPLYNYMIDKGMKIKISNIPFEKVHVLGTPKEVEKFRKLRE